jgi:hypothetical protein
MPCLACIISERAGHGPRPLTVRSNEMLDLSAETSAS